MPRGRVVNGRMSFMRAKAKYRFSTSDFERLDCITKGRGHPQRWYLVSDLNKLAATKREVHAAAEVAVQAASVKHKRGREEQAAEALQTERAAKRQQTNSPVTQTHLPVEVWATVLKGLVFQNVQPDGSLDPIRSVIIPVQEVCTAARVCRELRLAAQDALVMIAADPRVQQEVQTLAGAVPDNLQTAIESPTSLLVPQLKQLARTLKCRVTGTKAVLAVRVLEQLRAGQCAQGTPPPAALVWLARSERIPYQSLRSSCFKLFSAFAALHRVQWRYPDLVKESSMSQCSMNRLARRLSLAAAYPTLAHVQAVQRQYEERNRAEEQRRAEQQAQLARQQAARKAAGQRPFPCRCGQTASPYGSTGLCGTCCKGPCKRHRQ